MWCKRVLIKCPYVMSVEFDQFQYSHDPCNIQRQLVHITETDLTEQGYLTAYKLQKNNRGHFNKNLISVIVLFTKTVLTCMCLVCVLWLYLLATFMYDLRAVQLMTWAHIHQKQGKRKRWWWDKKQLPHGEKCSLKRKKYGWWGLSCFQISKNRRWRWLLFLRKIISGRWKVSF